jgi:alkylation response protein AidB-like acyl-CoA dehydrogenase
MRRWPVDRPSPAPIVAAGGTGTAAMETGQGKNDSLELEVSLASSNAAESAAAAVDLIRSASGTSGIYEGNKIERCWRDVNMVTQRIGASPSNYTRTGARYRANARMLPTHPARRTTIAGI